MNINNDNKNQFNWNSVRIDKAAKHDQLYLVEFKDDVVKKKSGWGYLKATLKHALYTVTPWGKAKNKSEENKQFLTLFQKNSDLLKPAAQQPKNVIAKINPKSKYTDRIKTFGERYLDKLTETLLEQVEIAPKEGESLRKVSFKKFEAVKTSLEPVHRIFVAENGPVELIDGNPMPSLAQLKAAFKLAEHLQPLFDMSTTKSRAGYARAIQYIMMGNKIDQIPLPKDDICFTCKELKALDFSETIHMEGPKAEENPSAPILQADDAIDWIITTTSTFRDNPSPATKREAVRQTLYQFGIDLFRIHYITIGGIKCDLPDDNAPIDEKNRNLRVDVFKRIQEDFFEALAPLEREPKRENEEAPPVRILNAAFIEQHQKYNETFPETLGYDNDFSAENCQELIREIFRDQMDPEFLDHLLNNFRFSREKLALLIPQYCEHFKCSNEQAEIQLNKILIFHFLRVIMLTTQGTQTPREIGQNFQTNLILLNIQSIENSGAFGYHINSNAFEASGEEVFSTDPNQIANSEEVASEIGGDFVPILRATRGKRFLSLIGSAQRSDSVCQDVIIENARVSPLAVGLLDQIIEQGLKCHQGTV